MDSALPFDPPRRLVRALGSHPSPGVAEAAREWLDFLPSLLRRRLESWELSLERVVSPGGRGSLVALVRQADGAPATLKLLAPGRIPLADRAAREAEALCRWNGLGAVRLLRAEPAEGALLLERLHCEVSLRSLPEAKAVLEATSAVMRLWVPPQSPAAGPSASAEAAGSGHGFPTVAERTGAEAERMRSQAPEETLPLVEEAVELRAALLADAPEQLLLHGDFRQGTVLSADAERAPWLVVGPEPLVGERTYDLARLVRDRLHDLVASSGAPATARRRVKKLADSLDLDADRLRGWSHFRAVESGVRHLASGQREDGKTLLEFAGWL